MELNLSLAVVTNPVVTGPVGSFCSSVNGKKAH